MSANFIIQEDSRHTPLALLHCCNTLCLSSLNCIETRSHDSSSMVAGHQLLRCFFADVFVLFDLSSASGTIVVFFFFSMVPPNPSVSIIHPINPTGSPLVVHALRNRVSLLFLRIVLDNPSIIHCISSSLSLSCFAALGNIIRYRGLF